MQVLIRLIITKSNYLSWNYIVVVVAIENGKGDVDALTIGEQNHSSFLSL